MSLSITGGAGATAGEYVRRIERCRLRLEPYRWPLAENNADAITAHWQQASARNPGFFNGTVLLLSGYRIDGATLEASAFATEFRNYLYWRDNGFADVSIVDGFGSAIIRSSDGGLLLARQRGGNVNAGLYYLPGGFIDMRDVSASGVIDIEASIAREVAEETGLAPDAWTAEPGFIVTRRRQHLSLAMTCRTTLSSEDLGRRVAATLSADPDGELDAVKIVHSRADIAGLPLADYCYPLLPRLLD